MAESALDEVFSRFGAMARELLPERLQTMVREGRRAEALDGLRTVSSEARAEVIAAAFMPDEPEETGRGDQEKQGVENPLGQWPRQDDLF